MVGFSQPTALERLFGEGNSNSKVAKNISASTQFQVGLGRGRMVLTDDAAANAKQTQVSSQGSSTLRSFSQSSNGIPTKRREPSGGFRGISPLAKKLRVRSKGSLQTPNRQQRLDSGKRKSCDLDLCKLRSDASERPNKFARTPENPMPIVHVLKSGTKKRKSDSLEGVDVIGHVSETVKEHRQRHPTPLRFCARCQWIEWGDMWKLKQGSSIAIADGVPQRIEWAAPRPLRKGGAFALGCSVCAYAVDAVAKAGSCRAQGCLARLNSKWARFEVRPRSLQAHALAQHAGFQSHKLALQIFLAPERPLRFALADDSVIANDDLLKGSVPQPSDWLHAWRYLKEGQSFREAARLAMTDDFIHKPAQCPSVSRHALKALMLILVEVVRIDKRLALRLAYCVALALDDRGAYKLVRFRCDYKDSFKEGVFGVLHRGGEVDKTVENWEDDFCEREAESVLNLLRAFCTTLDKQCDEGLLNHLLHVTRIYVSDGCSAALKTGRVLRHKGLKNLAFILRDPAHALRIAGRDPLHAEERFGAFWREMFDSKHALIRDVQNSDQMRAKLESCQVRVRQVLGSQGGGLAVILKHLSAAPQRFEAFASPSRRYCLLLLALALLLAIVASDERKDKATRARSEQLLESITPDSIVTAGLTGAYTDECLHFVRALEKTNGNPARLANRRDAYVERMTKLFLQGAAALEPPADESADHTLLQIVMAQVRDCPVFHYNDKELILWSAGSSSRVLELMARMATVVSANIARVHAELSNDDLLLSFQCFNMSTWSDAAMSDAKRTNLLKHFSRLCRSLREDSRVGVQELERALPAAVRIYEERKHADAAGNEEIDDRHVWGELLESDLLMDFVVLPRIIRYYNAVPLGTADVERGLGELSSVLEEHNGPIIGNTVWALLEGRIDGPKKEEELFSKNDSASQVLLGFTDFSRTCQRLWIRHHGRRFLVMSKTRSRIPRPKKLGTETAIKKGCRRAATAQAETNFPSDAKCFGGLKLADLSSARLERQASNFTETQKMKNFKARTAKILEQRKRELQLRRLPGEWCTKPVPRVARPEPKKTAAPSLPKRIFVVPVNCVVAPSPLATILESKYPSLGRAHVVVVKDLLAIERIDTWEAAVISIYAVGLGLILIQEQDWQGDRPWEGPKTLHYQPAATMKAIHIVAGSHVQKHSNAMKAFNRCAENTKWSVSSERVEGIPESSLFFLNGLHDIRNFVIKQRRLYRKRSVNGTFQKV